MQIIGIAGRAGSGKSEVARMVWAMGDDVQVVAFADKLKEIAEQLGWDGKKDTRGRKLLQQLGTDCARAYDSQVWVKCWRQGVERCGEVDYIIADDVRFENEAAEIRRMGGCVVRVVRPELPIPIPFDHVSERPLPQECIDYIIQNDGNLDQLREKVGILLREIDKSV